MVHPLGHYDSGEVPLVKDDEPQFLPGLRLSSLHAGQDAREQGTVLHTAVENLVVIIQLMCWVSLCFIQTSQLTVSLEIDVCVCLDLVTFTRNLFSF